MHYTCEIKDNTSCDQFFLKAAIMRKLLSGLLILRTTFWQWKNQNRVFVHFHFKNVLISKKIPVKLSQKQLILLFVRGYLLCTRSIWVNLPNLLNLLAQKSLRGNTGCDFVPWHPKPHPLYYKNRTVVWNNAKLALLHLFDLCDLWEFPCCDLLVLVCSDNCSSSSVTFICLYIFWYNKIIPNLFRWLIACRFGPSPFTESFSVRAITSDQSRNNGIS